MASSTPWPRVPGQQLEDRQRGSSVTIRRRFDYATDLADLNSRFNGQPDDNIRLVRTVVFPGGHVECTLAVFSLKTAPLYDALSYSWNAGNQDIVNIIIAERLITKSSTRRSTMEITGNLKNAIRRLHSHQAASEWLWIDAICVDQAHAAEKADQVNMMRDIYMKAKRVCVWLGESVCGAIDESRLSRGLIAEADMRNMVLSKEKAWWFRLWVIQELALGREVMVCLGNRTVPWDDFVVEMDRRARLPGQGYAKVHKQIHGLDRIRRYFRSHGCMLMADLLYYSIGTYATEPRDKINGLLGLASLDTRTRVKASHVDSFSALFATTGLFATTCLSIIDETQSLDILVGQWLRAWRHGSDNDHRRSWIPCFADETRDHTLRLSSTDLSLPNKDRPFPGSNSTTRASGTTIPMYSCNDDQMLSLQAVSVDLVSSLGPVFDSDITWFLLASRVFPLVQENTDVRQRRHFWHTLPSSFASLEELASNGWTKDKNFHVMEALRYVSRMSKDYHHKFAAEVEDWLAAVGRVLYGRTLFRTRTGYLGVANQGIQEGDLAIVPFGASVPFLLRVVTERFAAKKQYRLVDGCIIHGVMAGELMDAYEAGEAQSQIFDIV
ncbi:hypothetical protein LTR56_023719 [Elasticomyces elasticus]|nr:hypothetical protein LTR56_023719 [Elasticomyces elasticus]KAK3624740.1 hypothetical protein LTR22_023851 [Elasticomyces elasticus]KAK5765245.1 hypothetical protein LTS12_004502 [Elasticomyces elasticus]